MHVSSSEVAFTSNMLRIIDVCARSRRKRATAARSHAIHTDERQRLRTAPTERQQLGQVCKSDGKHVYTRYTQRTASNGSLSRDEAAEPALEACYGTASEGRNERPARARASARTARHTGRRRSHLAACPGHLHRAEAEPEAACTRAQSAGERRVRGRKRKRGGVKSIE